MSLSLSSSWTNLKLAKKFVPLNVLYVFGDLSCCASAELHLNGLQTSKSELLSTYRASLKLAYKDLSLEDKKRAETAKKMDPKKAEQLERLGMAYSGGSR